MSHFSFSVISLYINPLIFQPGLESAFHKSFPLQTQITGMII